MQSRLPLGPGKFHVVVLVEYYLLNGKRFLYLALLPNSPIGDLYANYGKYRGLGCICWTK